MSDAYFESNNVDNSLSIDMNAVEEQSFEAIPKGTYAGVIEAVEFKYSQSSGKPMWSVVIVITEGEFNGRKLYHNMSFSEKALPMTKGALNVIAPELLNSTFNPKAIADSNELTGKVVRFKTKLEDYKGEPQTRIQTFLRPSTMGEFGMLG